LHQVDASQRLAAHLAGDAPILTWPDLVDIARAVDEREVLAAVQVDGLGALTTTVGTRIPTRIPGTAKRMRGSAAIGFLPTAAFSAEEQCDY
jgi:hypothetical protein